MSKMNHFKEIVDHNLEQMDLTPEQKKQVREQVMSAPKSSPRKKKRWWAAAFPVIAAALVCAVVIPITYQKSSSFQSIAMDNLMENITPTPPQAQLDSTENSVQIQEDSSQKQETESTQESLESICGEDSQADSDSSTVSSPFIAAMADFSLELFRQSQDTSRNFLLSPASVAFALGMASNGSAGNTQEEFLNVLGKGQFPQEQLNQFYFQWANRITSLAADREDAESINQNARLEFANSIWYNQGFAVHPDFLQTAANYFDADAYQLDFSNSQAALKKMDQWIQSKTDGKLTEAAGSLDPNAAMVLINTTFFEMPWKDKFEPDQVSQQPFYLENGQQVITDFMHSCEDYLESDRAQGMKKYYRNTNYSFVAILPKDGISLEELVQTMTGEEFLRLVNHPNRSVLLDMYLPKFQYQTSNDLKKPLQNMALKEAFHPNQADFSPMSAQNDPLYLDSVVQNTFIDVNEEGTSAGAVTEMIMEATSAPPEERKTIVFDRPFLYAILDNQTGLPLFLGSVTNPTN